MAFSVTSLRKVSLLLLFMIPVASSMAASKVMDVRSSLRRDVTWSLVESGGDVHGEHRRGQINIEFGGDKHGVNEAKGYLIRPEAVKSRACTTSGCSDCSNSAKCWHGDKLGDWDYTVLNLQGGETFTHYEAEVWASCPSSSNSAEWWLEAPSKWRGNGVLEVYAGSTKLNLGSKWTVVQKGGDRARIRIVWRPNNMAQASHAKVWLEAYKVDAKVDACMAVTDCLSLLGDGSPEAYTLRNDNVKQWNCLTDKSSMSAEMLPKCEEWDNCLTTSNKKVFLRSLLGAAIKKSTSLLEGVSFENENRSQLVDAPNCNNPQVDDPESWDCECVEEMTSACSDNPDLETCIKALLCNNINVCHSWKAEHCPAFLMEQRRQESTKAATTAQLHDGLDNAVQGKCSQ